MQSNETVETLTRLGNLVLRNRILLAIGLLLGIAGGLIHASRSPHVYSATAKVAIGNTPWRNLLPEVSTQSTYAELMTFETQPLVIQSAPVAERAARSTGIPDMTAARIQAGLQVAKVEGTRVFAITSESGSGENASKIANAVADAYIQVTRDTRSENARESIRWLENQLVDYEQKVQKSHQLLIDYVEKESLTHLIHQPDGNASGGQLLDDLRKRRVEADLDLDRLLNRYGDRHPDVVEKRREVVRLGNKIKEEEQVLRETQKKTISYDILAGRAHADLDLYGVLARKLEQASISGSMTEDAISIVEYAPIPKFPIRPNRKRMVIFAAAAGLLFAMGTAFLRETLAQRVLTTKDLTEITDLPILGAIPEVGTDVEHTVGGAVRLFSRMPTASSEALRNLRANVKFSLVGIQTRVVVLTSSLPGEGKSIVTANIAAALAGVGMKVAVVDGDLRRPTLHRYFSNNVPVSGLSTVISGDESDVRAAIMHGGDGEPDLLPAGPTPPNPGDFLESPLLGRLIDTLKGIYDLVLIDSPPSSYFADAQVLGNHSGGIIVVVRAGIAHRNGLIRLLAQLRQSGNKVLGLVFNGTSVPDHSYSYYGAPKPTAVSAAEPRAAADATGE